MVASEAAPSTPTTRAPALAAYSTSARPASMVFMSATMTSVGPAGLELAHGLQALALDERRAGLQPVGAAGDGFLGHLQGAGEVDEVQGQLQDGFHRSHRSSLASGRRAICTTTVRSRGRLSKQTKQISCQRPRQSSPSSKGTTREGPSRPARTWAWPLTSGWVTLCS